MDDWGNGRGPIRILVVDDHEAVRVGLRLVLDAEPDMAVVGFARSGAEALEMTVATEPDVVLLDFRLPGCDGAAVCASILRRRPTCAVIILTSGEDDRFLHASLVAGARGFLTKNGSATQIADAVRRVARGEAVLAPEAVLRVVEWARQARAERLGAGILGSLEREILQLVSMGMSNRAIAGRLRVSEDAVKNRVREIKARLGASDRAHAVALATKQGLL